ncbi:MAG: metallopeptidase family protein [Lachnospiraceae bacterium]|nr:metallopeptidase family protein [Lachnospiraceae bacterium]MDD3795145.1 metallopeptidase family protein [Lachnospiraceae bacterium]
MVTLERFEEITDTLADLLPEEFFRELSGGIMVKDQIVYHPASVDQDLYTLGEYHRHPHLGRFVVLYYGSFMACYNYMEEKELEKEIWRVLRHEFLHHLESLAGERGLEVEDAIKIAGYRRRKGINQAENGKVE